MLLWQHLTDDVASSIYYFTGDLNNELVRHFLIESSSKGVKLKGCPNEPYFGKQKLPPRMFTMFGRSREVPVPIFVFWHFFSPQFYYN